ncbi:unnamed protein product [Meganyctiphanes norvegica]|uniref:Gustatory receptor n=1 Tax=Meganyctiphanes norvegica TaxID=48144 RepID=A0AAV2R2Y3_MEGNR
MGENGENTNTMCTAEEQEPSLITKTHENGAKSIRGAHGSGTSIYGICIENKADEPNLIKQNQDKLCHFRRFGLFLVKWRNNKYEGSQKRLLLYYIIWYTVAIGSFVLAFLFKQHFKRADYVDKVDDFIEASFVVVLIGVLPAIWIYLLREYNTTLPQILMIAKLLENSKIYNKLEIAEKRTKISYREGFADDDHDDVDDELNIETNKVVEKQSFIVRYGPLIGILLSVAVCAGLIFYGLIEDLVIYFTTEETSSNTDSFDNLKKEFPNFMMSIVYPLPYYISTWFCIFFLEWQRQVYESVRHLIRKYKIGLSVNNSGEINGNDEVIENIGCIDEILNPLQKSFILLNKKIFQKTIVIDFSLFMSVSTLCCWKILQASSNFAYIIPFSLNIWHIYLMCKWSNDLMIEYSETVEVLNEMRGDDVEKLKEEFQKVPPQVVAFGGFTVNYSMLTAVLAFILSCIGIPGEMWPEEDGFCYQYHNGDGLWNKTKTLCLKKEIFIKANDTLTFVLRDTED